LGALGASGFPQLGQVGVVSMTVFHTYSSGIRGECYREKGAKLQTSNFREASKFKFQIRDRVAFDLMSGAFDLELS
jgi:hypothetical protein